MVSQAALASVGIRSVGKTVVILGAGGAAKAAVAALKSAEKVTVLPRRKCPGAKLSLRSSDQCDACRNVSGGGCVARRGRDSGGCGVRYGL